MRWGYIDGPPSVRFVESANPQDLSNRLAALLTTILNVPNQTIVAVDLAGAGDGDVFTVRVEYGPTPQFIPIGQLPFTFSSFTPYVYMADNVTELDAERTRLYAASPLPQNAILLGSDTAGATQSRRVCVLELAALTDRGQ
jgi:hypothetical protein